MAHSHKVSNDLAGAVAAGVGYGLMHTAMMYGAVLSASGGEAAWVRDACPRINAFAMTAAQALLLNLLHVPLTVVAFDAYRRWSAARAAVPVAIHLAFALVGLLVEGPTPAACASVLPLQAALVGVAAFAAFRVIVAPDYAGTRQVAQWESSARNAIVQTWAAEEAYAEREQLVAASVAGAAR